MNEVRQGNAAPPFRALAIDGGGMRGFYSASLLDALSRRFGGASGSSGFDLGARCNLISGTSTGAILACALAARVPLPDIMDLYRKRGKLIFPCPVPRRSWLSFFWLLRHCFRPSANAKELRSALVDVFGEKTLAKIYQERKIALCIPTINAETYKAWVFKTPHIPGNTRDNEYTLTDICMASSAAPMFFPIHMITNPYNKDIRQGFVDGGLWANNAILVALVEALQIASPEQEIHIIAVGTASRPNGDPNALKNPVWGIFRWKGGIEAAEMSIAAQAYGYDSTAGFIARSLSEGGRAIKVVRLEETQKSPEKHSAIGLDRADDIAIQTMAGMAEDDASNIHSSKQQGSHWYSVVHDLFS